MSFASAHIVRSGVSNVALLLCLCCASIAVNASLPTVSASSKCSTPSVQTSTLVRLYESTDGKHWHRNDKWGTGDPCRDGWYGVTCEATPDMPSTCDVTEVDLESNGLRGTLQSLGGLNHLRHLYLSVNDIKGTIPPLEGLTNIRNLWLDENQLSGTIPSLSDLVNMRELVLTNNQLSGTIPPLQGLTELQRLSLEYNKLSGTIPSLSGLKSLQRFKLARNELSGTIPSLNGLEDLERLELSYAGQLSGTIPSLSGLKSIQYLGFTGNELSGTIPPLSGLSHLQELYLDENDLSGDLRNRNDILDIRRVFLTDNSFPCPLPMDFEDEAGPCLPYTIVTGSIVRGLKEYLANSTNSAVQTFQHICVDMQKEYPPVHDHEMRLYNLSCLFAHNLQQNMTLFGLWENTVNGIPWPLFEEPVANALGDLKEYELKLEALKSAEAGSEAQADQAKAVPCVLRSEISLWSSNANDLMDVMRGIEVQMDAAERVGGSIVRSIENDIVQIQQRLVQEMDKLTNQIEHLESPYFLKTFGYTLEATVGTLVCFLPVPPRVEMIGTGRIMRGVNNTISAASRCLLAAQNVEALEGAVQELADTINDARVMVGAFESLTLMTQPSAQPLAELPELYLDQVSRAKLNHYLKSFVSVLQDQYTGAELFQRHVSDLADISRALIRMTFAWYSLQQKAQSYESQVAIVAEISTSLVQQQDRVQTNRNEYVHHALLGLELAKVSSSFRALWFMQSELRQLNYASLGSYSLAPLPSELTSSALEGKAKQLQASVLQYQSAAGSGTNSQQWFNFTLTNTSNPAAFASLAETGNISFAVPIAEPQDTAITHAFIIEVRCKIYPLKLNTSTNVVGVSLFQGGEGLFYDSHRELKAFSYNRGSLYYSFDPSDFFPRAHVSIDSEQQKYIHQSPFGSWTLMFGEHPAFSLSEVTHVELFFFTSFERVPGKSFESGVFGNDYPFGAGVQPDLRDPSLQ